MPHSEDYKEVLFDQYCPTCEHKLEKETEDPCCACLDEPTNLYSHKKCKKAQFAPRPCYYLLALVFLIITGLTGLRRYCDLESLLPDDWQC